MIGSKHQIIFKNKEKFIFEYVVSEHFPEMMKDT